MFTYLIWSLLFGVIGILLFLKRKDLRTEMLHVSFLLGPFGLTQPLFVPDYWNPIVIHKFFGLFDIESILHVFFLAGISAVMYEELFGLYHDTVKFPEEFTAQCRKKCNVNTIIGFLIFLAVFLIVIRIYTDYSVLRSSFIFSLIMSGYLLKTRADLRKEGLLGGIIFMTFYITSLFLMDYLFPGFVRNEWNFEGNIGIFLLNLPIEEYFYAFFFGLISSVIYEYRHYVVTKKS